MKKADYNINASDFQSSNVAREHWDRVKNSRPAYHSIYDIRCDERMPSSYERWLLNPELKALLLSSYDGDDWASKIDTHELHVFEGFVCRLIQQSDRSYYVESKGISEGSLDLESGWHGFMGLNPIIPEAKKAYRYMYQPYIPGNAIRVQYLLLDEPDAKWKTHVRLHIEVENNIYVS